MRSSRTKPVLNLLLAASLAGCLIVGAWQADREAARHQEFATGCDPFGYLESARIIREARAKDQAPHWSLESHRFRVASDLLISKGFSQESFQDVIGPHSTHRFFRTGKVGIQYPPGTGEVLSLFEEGTAVATLNRCTLLALLGLSLVLLGWASRRSPVAMGMVALAGMLEFHVVANLREWSYSVNALLLPLIACGLLVFMTARWRRRSRTGLAAAGSVGAGLLFGVCWLIRLPCMFFAPGLLLLLESWNDRLGFALGAFLGGVLPWASYNQLLTGAWYVPTYMGRDATAPSLEVLAYNINYYFGNGPAAGDNMALHHLAVGALGLAAGLPTAQRLGWLRSPRFWGIVAIWAIPAVFFASHQVVTPYYMTPCNVLFCFLASLACADAASKMSSRWTTVLALVPLIYVFNTARLVAKTDQWAIPKIQAVTKPQLPEELKDGRVWIWADSTSGTFWHYWNVPTIKFMAATPAMRKALMKWARDHREPQFLIEDSESFAAVLSLGQAMGGHWVKRGSFSGASYYRLDWPTHNEINQK